MRNILLTVLVVAGLFVIMGCTGQTTTTQTNQNQNMPAYNGTSGPNISAEEQQAQVQQQAEQEAIQQAQQAMQNQSLPKTFECAAGTHWSGESGMQGTIVGVETFKGKQTCHVTYSFSAEAKFDYYIDMTDITSVCYVMSGGPGTESTEVCNWQ
ncbi:Uncharacterised protein [uncultured archaeon]|nr:Uncharacterised protein [uncultured archaeon]